MVKEGYITRKKGSGDKGYSDSTVFDERPRTCESWETKWLCKKKGYRELISIGNIRISSLICTTNSRAEYDMHAQKDDLEKDKRRTSRYQELEGT